MFTIWIEWESEISWGKQCISVHKEGGGKNKRGGWEGHPLSRQDDGRSHCKGKKGSASSM